MKIKKQKFGLLSDGQKINLYTVSNDEMSFSVTNYGCTLTSIVIPSKTGEKDDILLGHSTLEGLLREKNCYMGAFVGRFANRIGKATFELNGTTYALDKNDGENSLHGGFNGYNRMIWKGEEVETHGGSGVRFTHTSKDGEQGFPGNVTLEVTYLLNDHNEITMRYRAETDRDTPISLTNHAYYNLLGQGKGSILNHELYINGSSVLEVNDDLIPTGKLVPVENTPFDFTTPKTIEKDFNALPCGYDHNYCINAGKGKVTLCASVFEPVTGRSMVVSTNQPGVQFYSGNFLNNVIGKNYVTYPNQSGFCLETQQYPDAPNHENFPSCIVHPGESWESITVHSFKW